MNVPLPILSSSPALRQIVKVALMLLVVLMPALVNYALLQQTQGLMLHRAYPFWSDEIWYWHQAQSFAEVGFGSGYYSIKEVPAPAAFSPFNSWGMFIPMILGSVAAVFGWTVHSLVVLNLLLLTGAIALFMWALRPSFVQIALLGVLFAVYSPIILYAYTSMITVLQMAIGIALAAGFVVVLRRREDTPRLLVMALVIGIGLAALIRLTWTFFYFPLILLLAPELNGRRWLLAFGTTAAAFMVAAVALMLTGAPYPNVLGDFTAALSSEAGIGGALGVLWQNVQTNIELLDEGDIFEIAFRQQFALFTGLLVLQSGWLWWRRRAKARDQMHALGMVLYILGVVFLLTVLIYDMKLSRDYRLFAPIILFAFLLVIAYRWWAIVLPIGITLLLMLPGTKIVYDIWTDWHTDPAGLNAYYAWGAEIEKHIQYEPDAPNRWCNTLLHSHTYVWTQTHVVMSVPAGIGLSTTFEQHDLPPPYQSRWLLLTDDEINQYSGAVNVVPLLDVPMGKLYYNRDSACPRVPERLAGAS